MASQTLGLLEVPVLRGRWNEVYGFGDECGVGVLGRAIANLRADRKSTHLHTPLSNSPSQKAVLAAAGSPVAFQVLLRCAKQSVAD